MMTAESLFKPLTLVLGGTGKTGRRIVQRLRAMGRPVRVGSRRATPAFDWNDRRTWAACLHGVHAVYVSYQPDLAVPGAVETVQAFFAQARASGVRQLVLLSGRGEAEAVAAEDALRATPLDWTILRASWFSQNFSEAFFLDPIRAGALALPVGPVAEPFVDAEDIADVAAAVLTRDGHAGRLYELTGPRALTFADAVGEIGAATGRDIAFARIPPAAYREAMLRAHVPADMVDLALYLFTTVLDGRNSAVADGVQQALGRAPRDFADYARHAAAAGAWDLAA